MAVVADYYMNPQNYPKFPQTTKVYEKLRDAGYGIIKMPHPTMIGKGAEGWVSTTVDQIQEYSNRGFQVFVLGVEGLPEKGIWMSALKKEIKQRGMPVPPSIVLKRKDLLAPDEIMSAIVK